MVFPRLHAIEALDRGLLRETRRAGGLIQRGRVVSVDDTYDPPMLTVSVHLRGGQSVTLPHVLTVSSIFDPAAIQGPDLTVAQATDMARPKVGQELLLLCPSGRAADECYAVGLASTATVLTDSLAASVDGYATVDESGLTVGFSIPAGPTDRLLTITGAAAVLGEGRRVSPTLTIDGETFRTRYSFPLLSATEAKTVSFEGRYSQTIPTNRAVVLQVTFSGDASIPLVSWDYQIGVTDTRPLAGPIVPQTLGGVAYPVVALYGRIE